MIVRLLGEGQFDVDEGQLDALNVLDQQLEAALAVDGEEYRDVLAQMAELVRSVGTLQADDFLGASDVTIPDAESSRADVGELLSEDGLIPG